MATAAPSSNSTSTSQPPQASPSTSARVLGIVLLLPALVVTLVQFAVPSVLTFVGSLQSISFRNDPEFIGLANYARVARLLPSGLGLAVALSLIAVVLAVLGGLVGTLAGRGGLLPRRATAAVAGVLLALYAPVGMAVALRHAEEVVTRPTTLDLIGLGLLVWLPPVVASGVLTGLLSSRPEGTRTGPLLASGLAGVVATGAVGLQELALPVVTVGLQPGTGSLQGTAYSSMFIRGDFGTGLAIEVIGLFGVGVLGIVATIVLAASRLRLELTGPTAARGGMTGWIGLGLAIVALVVVLIVHRGWLAGLVAPASSRQSADLATTWIINTWGPSLLLAVIQVVFAGLAGFGLGWLRPAGRGNGWLLLLFAPWLLIGAAPLVLQNYLTAAQLGFVGTWLTALPPTWVSLPALIGFSWLFGALGDAHRAAQQGNSTSTTARGVLTGAAGTVLIGSLLWLTAAQSLPWAYATGTQPEKLTGPVALLRLLQVSGYSPAGPAGPPQWISTPIPMLLLLAGLIAVSAVLATDRLALRVGKDPVAPPTVRDWGDGQTPEQAHASGPAAVAGRDRHDPVQD